WPAPRHGQLRRDADRVGPGPPGGALHLRDRAAVADPRPRDVHGGAGPLRRGSLAHRREGERRAQEGNGDRRQPLTEIERPTRRTVVGLAPVSLSTTFEVP